MIKRQSEESLDSRGYRKILEYIKANGIESLNSFSSDLKELERENLIYKAIMDSSHLTLSFTRKHKDLLTSLRSFREDINKINLASGSFTTFLSDISENIDLLDLYIRNAKALEELRVSKMNFVPRDYFEEKKYSTEIYRNKEGIITELRKQYTDGLLVVEDSYKYSDNCKIFNLGLKRNQLPNFVLESEVHQGYQFSYLDLSTLNFDLSKLPSLEEIRSLEEPKTLVLK